MAKKPASKQTVTFEVQTAAELRRVDGVNEVQITPEGALVLLDPDGVLLMAYAPGQWHTAQRVLDAPEPG
jgi:hypothetical protein